MHLSVIPPEAIHASTGTRRKGPAMHLPTRERTRESIEDLRARGDGRCRTFVVALRFGSASVEEATA